MNIPRPLCIMMLVAAVVAAGCSSSSDYVYVEPASVEEVGSDLWRVKLTAAAADRTGIQTTAVAAQTIDGAERLVIPYSAVMYHYDGTTWTYTNPDGTSYLREPIEIDYIDQDTAVLASGPSVGSDIVMVGAAELYGVEFGIGK